MNSVPQKSTSQCTPPTIIGTYPVRERDEARSILEEHGVRVINLPVIETVPIYFPTEKLSDRIDWLIFTSRNAVRHFFSRHSFESCPPIIVIGESTGKALEQFGLKATYVAGARSSEDFVSTLRRILLQEKQLLLIQGESAPDRLYQTLSKSYSIERIKVYATRQPRTIDQKIIQRIDSNHYDFILVTSPSAAKNLVQLIHFPEQLRLISIGKTTSEAIVNLKLKPVDTASIPSYKCLAETTLLQLQNLKNTIL